MFGPQMGGIETNPTMFWEPRAAEFKPHVFDARLAPDGIRVELTPTMYGAVLRVTFPEHNPRGLEKRICFQLPGFRTDSILDVNRDKRTFSMVSTRTSGGVRSGQFHHYVRVEGDAASADADGGFERVEQRQQNHMICLGYAKAQTGYGAQTLQNIFSSGKNLEAIACSPRAHSDRPLGPRWRHPTHPIRPCLRRRSRAVLLVDRGLLQYEDRFYGFTNQDCATSFAADIDGALEQILHNAKAHPELLELLQLHEHFSSIAPNSQTGIAVPKAAKKARKLAGSPLECAVFQGHVDFTGQKGFTAAALVEKLRIALAKPKSSKRKALEAEVAAGKVSRRTGGPNLGVDPDGKFYCLPGAHLAKDALGRHYIAY